MTAIANSNCIVTGASSLIGHFLLPQLLTANYAVQVLTRQDKTKFNNQRVSWHQLLPDHTIPTDVKPAPLYIHLAPLWVLPEILPQLLSLGIKRVIAFGSTSVFAKQYSADVYEQEIVAKLRKAEQWLTDFANLHDLQWTLFRPTLIYGAGLDHNITVIERFIKRYKFFPLLGHGNGLRQPVYADDLATACMQVLHNSTTYGKAYNLTGGETLSYRRMIDRIFKRLKRKPRIFPIPLSLFRLALFFINLIPRYQHWNIAMVERMNKDLCFDSSAAQHDFAYHARDFK